MSEDISKLSPSKQVASRTLHETLKILKEAGGYLPGREVVQKIRERLEFSEWEKAHYEKTGYVRWESILHFHSIGLIKAGFLRKNKGIWYLTTEGEKALKFGPVALLNAVSTSYSQWKVHNKDQKEKVDTEEPEIVDNKSQLQRATLDQLEEQAISDIKEHIYAKNAYEFQDLVAALLRALGYHTPFISPKGRDGGLDIVAYRDPLGASEPRIKVQVKHKPQSSVPVDDIRSLVGLLSKSGDMGLFVTSGTFSTDAERFARDSHIHVRLVNLDEFIQLWQEFYPKLNDEEKNMLPLHRLYFLGANE